MNDRSGDGNGNAALSGVCPPHIRDPGESVSDGDEAAGGERPRMLAVVPLGDRRELALLERARAISSEHGARLIVVGTWAPSWWFCLSMAAGSGAAATLLCLRQTSERRLTDLAVRAGVDLRVRLDWEQVGRAVDDELRQDRYGYVVGRRADLPRRLVRHWRARDPALTVIRF